MTRVVPARPWQRQSGTSTARSSPRSARSRWGSADMAMSAALEALLLSGRGSFAKLLEVDLPHPSGGSTNYKKWSQGGYSSVSAGHYDDRVLKWGRLRWGVSDSRSGTLEGSSATVEARDDDFELAKILEGGAAEKCYGSPVRIK